MNLFLVAKYSCLCYKYMLVLNLVYYEQSSSVSIQGGHTIKGRIFICVPLYICYTFQGEFENYFL